MGNPQSGPQTSGSRSPITPASEYDWKRDGGFVTVKGTSDGFYGVSPKGLLSRWYWKGDALSEGPDIQMPDLLRATVASANICIGRENSGVRGVPWPLVAVRFPENKTLKRWAPPDGWLYDNIGVSINQRFAAICLAVAMTNDEYKGEIRLRIGLLDLSSLELSWVGGLPEESITIRSIEVTGDGKYVALGGWKNNIVVVDTVAQKVLWSDRPEGVATLNYVAFTSDGATVYGAGDCGVYGYDTKTGKIKNQWVATETGQPIYGHRISCLAVSPDDSCVAAGTGPDGQVFLFYPADKPRRQLLDHGMRTISLVTFSPDSTHVASEAGGKIKVWGIGAGAK